MKTGSFTKRFFARSAILGFLIALAAAPAGAQAPSGSFTYVFTNLPLWDATGAYTNSFVSNGANNDQIVNFAQDAKGKLTGTYNNIITESGMTIDVTGSISGKVLSKGGVTGATLKLVNASFSGAASGPAKGGGILAIDQSTSTINNTYSLRLCITGRGCETFTGTVGFALPADMTGDWTLDTTISATGTKLSGTATLTLSNGRVLNYNVVGAYNAKTTQSKLKLIGTGDAVGTSLSLVTTGSSMGLTSLKGKVLGQTPTVP